MKTQKNNINESQVEVIVELSTEEMVGYNTRAAENLTKDSPLEGFRPGKAPYEVVKSRLGEAKIMEEASRLAINKTLDEVIKEACGDNWFGQPSITIVKLAPNNPFEYKVLITILPEVKLGDFSDLKVEKESVKVEDSDVEKTIDQLREARASDTAVDRPSQKGDKITLSIKMFLDKVPLDGGQTPETNLVIGKDYIVPGFDDNLIGLKAGDSKDFFVKYPDDHHMKNIAGKEVEFSVSIKQVFERILPEMNDELAAKFGMPDATKLREAIKENLTQEKEQQAEVRFEEELIGEAVKRTSFGPIHESLVEQETRNMLEELKSSVQRSGGVFADYLSSLNKNEEALRQDFVPKATDRLKASLMFREVVKTNELKVSDEEIAGEVAKLKSYREANGQEIASLDSLAAKRHLEAVLLNRRVLDWFKEKIK